MQLTFVYVPAILSCVYAISSGTDQLSISFILFLSANSAYNVQSAACLSCFKGVCNCSQHKASKTGQAKHVGIEPSLWKTLGSLSNHDDDGNKNPTNLHIWQWKTGFLHALHVHFSVFDVLKTFSFFLRRQTTCVAVVWTTWAYDYKCSIFSPYVPSAGSNLIPG